MDLFFFWLFWFALFLGFAWFVDHESRKFRG